MKTKFILYQLLDLNMVSSVSISNDGIKEETQYVDALQYLNTYETEIDAINAIELANKECTHDESRGFTILKVYQP